MDLIRRFVDSFRTKSSETVNFSTNQIEVSTVNFLFEVPNVEGVKVLTVELPTYIRNLPWKIMLKINLAEDGTNYSMSLFVICDYDKDNSWSCNTDVHLHILSFNAVKEPYRRTFKHRFDKNRRFMNFDPLIMCNELLDPSNFYIKNGKIVIEVIMKCEEPRGVSWNSKKHTGLVGLRNGIENSFLNSIVQILYNDSVIQILYCIESFRTAMISLSNENCNMIICVMQLIFLELQFSEVSVSIDKLIESMENRSFTSTNDSSVIFKLLHKILRKESATKQLSELFRAEVSTLSTSSGRYEIKELKKLYSVNMEISGKTNIEDALDKYLTSNCKDQNSSSFFRVSSWIDVITLYRWFYGLVSCTNPYNRNTQPNLNFKHNVEITKLPPILVLHLYRQYIDLDNVNTPVDEFKFCKNLKLTKYANKCIDLSSTSYVLHAVLVRKETFTAFINLPNGWLKFDSDIVSHCTEKESIDDNFGCVQMLVYLQSNNTNRNQEDDENVVKFTCIICMETTIKMEQFSTICGHVFCGPCIKTEISLRQKCPVCKNNLAERDIHPIYI